MRQSLLGGVAVLAVGLSSAACAMPLSAQGGPFDTTAVRRAGAPLVDGGNACLDALPKDAGREATAYLGVSARDTISPTLRSAADNFAAAAADEIRHALGVTTDTLPQIARMTTGMASTSVMLIVRRNGPLGWTASDSAASTSKMRGLLLGALESMARDGESIIWPDGVVGDSARIRLHVEIPSLVNGQLIGDETLPVGVPVYRTRILPETPAAVARGVHPDYPEPNRRAGWSGTVFMQFVVDTSGRAEASTVRDFWPKDAPPLDRDRAEAYSEFVGAAKRSIRASTYYPAELSGCKVRQVVRQAFVFNLRH